MDKIEKTLAKLIPAERELMNLRGLTPAVSGGSPRQRRGFIKSLTAFIPELTLGVFSGDLIKVILPSLSSGNTKGLDIKRLKGQPNIFRIRKGNLRIIYQLDGKAIFLLAIERQKEKTYKNF